MRNKANSVGDIHQVLALSVYLDMTLIELLIQIVESQYFLTCQHVLEHIGDFKGTGLEFLAPAILSYFQIINELEDYRNKHFNSSAEKRNEKNTSLQAKAIRWDIHVRGIVLVQP